ncbi:hypothetical protein [Azospira inquinata]|uniref:Uncharacterized protein n=1 Tax=Azospira inquinata TaxID=2785627 RepID=A0A975XV40_9RHOO|nr:hypothetical protein [Azospira inquinata]QWT45258.1 hypothetical protein J8L76_09900 [Azospira inquinata]QWT49410.1 hypothetical protein Azoinq_01980 [Azospira inquinata]
MKISRNHLSLVSSIILLASAMVVWPNLFLWSKVAHLPAWAEHLPAPVFTGAYVSFVCLIPAALWTDTFSSAKRALLSAVIVAPVFAVATYTLSPEHQDQYLLFNVLFHYVWVILFCMFVPACALAAIRKIIGNRRPHGDTSRQTLDVMNLEPPSLNVPLYRRDSSKIWLPILAGLTAWLWHRPMAIPQAAISFFVGGAFLWLVFCSDISDRISNHRVPVIRGLWFVAIILGITWFMRHVIPYLHALV